MLINVIVLYIIFSIYFIKDLFPKNRLSNHAASVASLSALLWFGMNIGEQHHPLLSEISICIAMSMLYAIFLMYFNLLSIEQPFKKIFLGCSVIWWTFFAHQGTHMFYYKSLIFNKSELILLSLGSFLFIFIVFLRYLKKSSLPTLWKKITFEKWLISAFFISHIITFIFTKDFKSNNRFICFFIVYLSFFIPHIIVYPIHTLKLYLNSIVFSSLFIIFGKIYHILFTLIKFPDLTTPTQWFFYIFSPILMVVLFNTYSRISKIIEKSSIFSIINHSTLSSIIKKLENVTDEKKINALLTESSLFKSKHHALYLWNIQNLKYSHITNNTPTLDPEIILFLQYKEAIYSHDIENLLVEYKNTPFQLNVKLLNNFMKAFSIVKISLFQKTNEMVGVIAISLKNSRSELLSFDNQQLKLLESVISNTLCNTNSVSHLLNHQNILQYINTASSQFNISITEDTYYTIIRKTLIKIIPEIQFYFLLKYDADSQFYKRSFLLTKKHRTQALKIHSNIINNDFNDNMFLKYSITHEKIPHELELTMKNIGANEAILIRLNESANSSIFVLFFKNNIDVLDYRISFCQMFLRQSEIFYQYQENCEKLNRLQLFLKKILDQLPTGILIINDLYQVKYINSKMDDQLQYPLSDKNNIDIRNSNVPSELIAAINDCQQKNEYTKKVTLPIKDHKESTALFLLSAFKVTQEIETYTVVVLTNIQQSKELIDQMNQTNRLAMMSKIAKGISYELSKPVDQLINGVQKIETKWNNSKFQDYFITDVIPQIDRINLLCQSLLRLSRSNTESLVEIFLPDLLDQVLRLISGDLRYTTQKFYVGVLDRSWIIVDQVMAIQVLMNLMMFCLKSLSKETSRLSLDIQILSKNLLNIKIAIKNYKSDGFRVENDLKDQLELSIVNQIVMNQNGQFDIYCENQIASFDIMLPIKKLQTKPKKHQFTSP